jgi:hypothetical protein
MKFMRQFLLTSFFIAMAFSTFAQLTYTEDYYGNTTVTDSYGNVVAKGSNDYYGNYIWKDPYGNILYTQSKDYYGNIITKDAYGNVVATYKRNYNQTQMGTMESFGGVSVFNVRPSRAPNVGGIDIIQAPRAYPHKS